MTITSTSLAAGVGSSVRNVQFQPAARNLPRKIAIVGTFDVSKTTVVEDTPLRVFSAAEVGAKFGFGSMLHRLALAAFTGGLGVPTYIIPQAEGNDFDPAAGQIDFSDSTGVLSGTIFLYLAGIRTPVNVGSGATVENITDAVVAAVNANNSLPVTASKKPTTFETILTSKSSGAWGNGITVDFNLGYGEVLPQGVVADVTAMTGGAGTPDISTGLSGLGENDDANSLWITDLVHGYGVDTGTLDAISEYVGAGNEMVGLYSKTVARPFRSLTGDTATGSDGFNALIALADDRRSDRANGVVSVPGSRRHPSEISALAVGTMARINDTRPEQSCIDEILPGVDPGDMVDRWTSTYDNRDTAVRSGISPTRVSNGAVKLQNLVSFYRPEDVAPESNSYRSMRNISILQNLLENIRLNFSQEKWKGISIVRDTNNVTNATSRQKARDVDSVKDDLTYLASTFSAKAWLFDAEFTINKLKESGSVTLRDGGTGFDNIFSVVLSGEGGILDTVTECDTNIAVFTA